MILNDFENDFDTGAFLPKPLSQFLEFIFSEFGKFFFERKSENWIFSSILHDLFI